MVFVYVHINIPFQSIMLDPRSKKSNLRIVFINRQHELLCCFDIFISCPTFSTSFIVFEIHKRFLYFILSFIRPSHCRLHVPLLSTIMWLISYLISGDLFKSLKYWYIVYRYQFLIDLGDFKFIHYLPIFCEILGFFSYNSNIAWKCYSIRAITLNNDPVSLVMDG